MFNYSEIDDNKYEINLKVYEFVIQSSKFNFPLTI